jgi:hypothetical protein
MLLAMAAMVGTKVGQVISLATDIRVALPQHQPPARMLLRQTHGVPIKTAATDRSDHLVLQTISAVQETNQSSSFQRLTNLSF